MNRKIGLFRLITNSLFLLSILISWGFAEAQGPCDIAVFQKLNIYIKGLNDADNTFVEGVYRAFKNEYPNLILIPEIKDLGYIRYNLTQFGIENIQDLQYQIQTAFNNNNCTCINELDIVGHGRSGIISVGLPAHAKYRDNTKYIDGNEDQWSGPLQQIKTLLCPSSTVYLIGCRVGECNTGSGKLFKLAQTLNATVTAPVDRVAGQKIIDYIDKGRWQIAKATDASQPSHMGATKNQRARRRAARIAGTGVGPGFGCPCNGAVYTDVQQCTSSCSVTLSCFTGICNPTFTSSNRWTEYNGNPVMTGGTTVGVAATASTEISGLEEFGSVQTIFIKNNPRNETSNRGSEPSRVLRIGNAGIKATDKVMESVSVATTAIPGWEDGGVAQPTVIKDGTTYKMWYEGWDASDTYDRIGYATSADEINWVKYSGNPILAEGPSGSWDSGSVYRPSVIKDGDTYKMWYHGYSDMSRIGYATSTDGINWTKYSQPVLDLGPTGDWDYHGVGSPTVIKDGDLYKMWYSGYDGWWWRIGYATSTDGINWTKYSDNPVLSEGEAGCWDEGDVEGPSVIKDGGTYHMLYSSQDANSTWRMGYAASKDGVNWTKSPDNPFMGGTQGDWDNEGVGSTTLFKDANENIFKVFYGGWGHSPSGDSTGGIGFATATSLLFLGDVSLSDWSEKYINALYIAGITSGCGDDNYCPQGDVTRGQMAAFITRSLYGENFSYTTTPYFTDVPSTHWAFKYVQKMKDDGLTTSTGTYNVDGSVTRGQMAAFMIRAKYGENFSCTQTPYFTDVPSTHWAFKYVQKMKDDGLTTSTGTYMVDDIVTRDQMAAFLARSFLEMQ